MAWITVFYLIFSVVQDNTLIWFQYKLMHRKLYKMCIEKTDICRFCQSKSETFYASVCAISICGGVMERIRNLDKLQLGEINKYSHVDI